MWALGRTLPVVAAHSSRPREADPDAPVCVHAAFKGPVYLGREVRVRGVAVDAAEQGRFEVYSGDNPRPSIVGRVCDDLDPRVLASQS